jgi:hypothetical protein
MVLVLQDPGGVPLIQLLSSARDGSAKASGTGQPLEIAVRAVQAGKPISEVGLSPDFSFV